MAGNNKTCIWLLSSNLPIGNKKKFYSKIQSIEQNNRISNANTSNKNYTLQQKNSIEADYVERLSFAFAIECERLSLAIE